MARDSTVSLLSDPTAVAPAKVSISHVQLRDLIICPRERGVVNYVKDHSIMEHNLNVPKSTPSPIVDLQFTPNTLAYLHLPDTNETLIAAGGQEAELHLSLHSPNPPTPHTHAQTQSRSRSRPHNPPTRTRMVWDENMRLNGSINNSVALLSMEGGTRTRVVVSNNDHTIRFFDVALRRREGEREWEWWKEREGESQRERLKRLREERALGRRMNECGSLRLDVPINHSSVSPDGTTLLSVGDSAQVYLHHLTRTSRLSFTPMAKLTLPLPSASSASSTIPASFSTAFSANGSKYAVASQEGVVAIYDVRSSKPLKIFNSRRPEREKDLSGSVSPGGNGAASGWISDDPPAWDWVRIGENAPGWGIRSVKFSRPEEGGKEVMAFTEHRGLLHVVDARTFEKEEIVKVPNASSYSGPGSGGAATASSSRPRSQSPVHRRPASPIPTRRGYSPSPSPPPPPPPFLQPSTSGPYLNFPEIIDGRLLRRPGDEGYERIANRMEGGRVDGGYERMEIVRDGDEDADNVVVMRPFGGDEEERVRRMLRAHRLRARLQERERERERREGGRERARVVLGGEEDELDEDDRIEVDGNMDMDADEDACLSSHEGSRANSPAQFVSGSPSLVPMPNYFPSRLNLVPPGSIPIPSSSSSSDLRLPPPVRSPVMRPISPRITSLRGWRPHWAAYDEAPIQAPGVEVGGSGSNENGELDLAGVCFDPSGRYLYVAAANGVVEWAVKGAEKRWWYETSWA